jgi:hypothetical protein
VGEDGAGEDPEAAVAGQEVGRKRRTDPGLGVLVRVHSGRVGPGGGTPGTSRNVVLVGHDPLFGRGMNSAMTIFRHSAYIGNRTDGSATCGVGDPRGPGANCPHPHPGVLIEDIADPANPHVVGEIGPPLEGNTGISSREVRVWPRAKLLVVMNFRCSSVIHACPPGNDRPYALTTDEIYGTFTDPTFGCPWGWSRLINCATQARRLRRRSASTSLKATPTSATRSG